MEMVHHILVVDDDLRLRDLLERYLTSQGFHTRGAANAAAMRRLIAEHHVDLIVLDLMLPDANGLDLCRSLRAEGVETPIIMLTAKGDEVDRIVGLEMGADDYLGKPFNPRELMARMKAILRRSQQSAEPVTTSTNAEFRIDNRKREIFYRERRIPLTDIEFTLLQYLLGRTDEVVSRDDISTALFEREARPYDRAVDMNISRLRKKLEDLSGFRGKIRSIRNSGYMFILNEEAEA